MNRLIRGAGFKDALLCLPSQGEKEEKDLQKIRGSVPSRLFAWKRENSRISEEPFFEPRFKNDINWGLGT
jgi:hypothetical protein